MIHKIGVVIACLGTILFPWPFSAVLAVIFSVFEPWLPFAIGLLIDAFYFSLAQGSFPLFALGGGVVTAIAFFVRSRLEAGIIKE